MKTADVKVTITRYMKKWPTDYFSTTELQDRCLDNGKKASRGTVQKALTQLQEEGVIRAGAPGFWNWISSK